MSLINGIKWVSLSQLSKILSQVISMVVLARLIPPSEFGVMSIAMVVVAFSSLFRDLGTSSAIIQRKHLTQELLSAILGLNIITASLITFIIIIFSPFVASFFNENKLIYVLPILSLSFPVMGLGSVQLSLLERDSIFKPVAIIEILASFISLLLAIISAFIGFGVYSLVILNISSAIISTSLLWLVNKWRPSKEHLFNLKEIKGIFSFSGHLTLFNLINYFSRNADNIIIGKILGTTILGAYSLAYRIMLFPLQSMTFVISRTLYPVMSRNQNDNDEIYKLYIKITNLIFFIVCPLMLGLTILREPFVILVFGEKWILTADILFWLAPTAIIQAILSTTGSVFMAKGKTNILFLLGIIGMILQVGAFIIGAQYDIVTLSKLYFYSNVLNAILPLTLVVKLLHGKMNLFLLSFLPIIFINFITFICVYYILKLNMFNKINIFNFIIVILGTIIFYLLISIPILKKYLKLK